MTRSASDIGLGRRALGLGVFTIAYNVLEGAIGVAAGAAAGAVSLIGFGLDSVIEVVAATVVVVRLAGMLGHGHHDERGESVALRIVGGTFFALAAYLLVAGGVDLVTGARPETSPVGIVLLAVSLVVMPTLAAVKRRVGLRMRSRLVVADAAETRLCALLSLSTLVALLAYAILRWTWLDAVGGFVIAAFALNEGREAWRGELLDD